MTSVTDTHNDVGSAAMGATMAPLVDYSAMRTVSSRNYKIAPQAKTMLNAWRDIEYGLQGLGIAINESTTSVALIRADNSSTTNPHAIETLLANVTISCSPLTSDHGTCTITIPYPLTSPQQSDLKATFIDIFRNLAKKNGHKNDNNLKQKDHSLPNGYSVEVTKDKFFFHKEIRISLAFPVDSIAHKTFNKIRSIAEREEPAIATVPPINTAVSTDKNAEPAKTNVEPVSIIANALKDLTLNLVHCSNTETRELDFLDNDGQQLNDLFQRINLRGNAGSYLLEVDGSVSSLELLKINHSLKILLNVAQKIEACTFVNPEDAQKCPSYLCSGYNVSLADCVPFDANDIHPAKEAQNNIKLRRLNVNVPTSSLAADLLNEFKNICNRVNPKDEQKPEPVRFALTR